MNKVRLLTAPLMALIKLHWIALCVVAGLVLVYALAGFFLVPRVARSQIESYVTGTLHRKVSIGDIRFNPFVFDASISDFRLTEANDAPLVSFRHLYVNTQLASLWQRAIVLREVRLAAPGIQLVIAKDASVNLAKLVPESAEPTPQEEIAPPRVRIGTLVVREGRIGVEDYTHSRPFTAQIAPIRFTPNDFRTDVGYENAYDFAGTTQSGEQLTWSGAFTVQPLGSAGKFGIHGLKAATIDAYLSDSLPFQLAAGEASLDGTYNFALSPALGLDVTLPLMQVSNLSLTERKADATAPIVLPDVQIHDVAFSYQKREVGVRLAEVRGAHIDAALEQDGSISLMRLINGASADSTTPASEETPVSVSTSAPQEPNSKAWRTHIERISVADASVTAEDRSVEPAAKFSLKPVQLTVDNWSTDANAKLQLDADITIDEKAHLLGKGELQLDPLSTRMAVDLKDFALPSLQPYVEQNAALTLHSGNLSLKGAVSYASTSESTPAMTFKGDVQVANLRTTDQQLNENFIKWTQLNASGIDVSTNPDKLTIDRIVARQPYARVVIAQDTSLNVSKVLRSESNADAAQATATEKKEGEKSSRVAKTEAQSRPASAAAASVFPMRIRSVQFIDGSANFADNSIVPAFATGILQLKGTVVGLSSDPASRAQVKLDGKVDKYAPVDITGSVNLLSAAMFTDVSMNFKNMELTTFNPYSGKFAGYNISKGKLSTELHYKVEDRKLDATHHIVVDNLEFGAKTDSKDAAPIPLKLAVALLKDRNGVIDLSLPVKGTLDDPKFRLGPIIWKAFVGLLTKIVTAPFAAIGALIGGGDELAFVDFPAGTAMLAPTEVEKLNKVAMALVDRPQLRLSVPLTVMSTQDSDALSRAQLAEKLPPEATAEAGDDRAKRKRNEALEKTYTSIAGAAPAYPPELKTGKDVDLDAQQQFLQQALLERMKPDDAALTNLARERARAVQDALLANTELNPSRVFITTERNEGKSEGEAVRMEMKLE